MAAPRAEPIATCSRSRTTAKRSRHGMSAEKSYIPRLTACSLVELAGKKEKGGRVILSAAKSGELHVRGLSISYRAPSVENGECGCDASLQIDRPACRHSVRPARYDLNRKLPHAGSTIDRVEPAHI